MFESASEASSNVFEKSEKKKIGVQALTIAFLKKQIFFFQKNNYAKIFFSRTYFQALVLHFFSQIFKIHYFSFHTHFEAYKNIKNLLL
jgi:hypothetical protein